MSAALGLTLCLLRFLPLFSEYFLNDFLLALFSVSRRRTMISPSPPLSPAVYGYRRRRRVEFRRSGNYGQRRTRFSLLSKVSFALDKNYWNWMLHSTVTLPFRS